jgi:hypothetical protein
MGREWTQEEIDAMERDFDDDDHYELDPMEEAEMECGLHRDGQCGLAGTEHCDFTCPFRDSEHFAGSAAWRAKHKKG